MRGVSVQTRRAAGSSENGKMMLGALVASAMPSPAAGLRADMQVLSQEMNSLVAVPKVASSFAPKETPKMSESLAALAAALPLIASENTIVNRRVEEAPAAPVA